MFNYSLSSVKLTDFLKLGADSIQVSLTPMQKKIVSLVLAVFSVIAFAFYAYRHFKDMYNHLVVFRSFKNEGISNQINPKVKRFFSQSIKLVEKKSPPLIPKDSFTAQVDLTPNKNLKTDCRGGDEPARKRTIAERLASNAEDAAYQQKIEKQKKFKCFDENRVSIYIGGGRNHEWIDLNTLNKVGERAIGISYCQGHRLTMEDTHIATTVTSKLGDTDVEYTLIGVFDGHGGNEASLFVQENIAQFLSKKMEEENQNQLTDEGVFNALKKTYPGLEQLYLDTRDGTTAIIAVILDRKIWFANLGDSRAILVDPNGKIVQATEDAKPDMDAYRKKVENLGGAVFNSKGGPRVNGILATPRAFGDKWIKGIGGECCISASPKLTCYDLDTFQGGYLVMACDGYWDMASTQETGEAIMGMQEKGMDEQEMAQILVSSAFSLGSRDNITLIVLKI